MGRHVVTRVICAFVLSIVGAGAAVAAAARDDDQAKAAAVALDEERTTAAAIDRLAKAFAQPAPRADDVRLQIDANQPLRDVYSNAALVEYAVLVLPDPRVPRHRRAYDLALRSVIAAMSDVDYMIDRYYFPWQGYVDGKPSPDAGDRWTAKEQLDDGKYGVLVFRYDEWRETDAEALRARRTSVRLRVLYVVAETATYGVQQQAMRNALARVVDEVAGTAIFDRLPARERIHHYIGVPFAADGRDPPGERIVVVGPNFSNSVSGLESVATGSASGRRVPMPSMLRARLHTLRSDVDLLGRRAGACAATLVDAYRRIADDFERALDRRDALSVDALALLSVPAGNCTDTVSRRALNGARDIAQEARDYVGKALHDDHAGIAAPGVLAISASTTVASNENVNAHPERFALRSLAVDDRRKFEHAIAYLRASTPHKAERVALLYETSSFGRGAYESLRLALGRPFVHATFPPNIADLRRRLREQESVAPRANGVADLVPDGTYLAIEDGVENGNEYPGNGGSSLTSVTADQQLRMQLASLRDRDDPPGVVFVAATDVRDRLYLFDRISRELPNASLVDLEADLLLAHPDYVHATRGALMVASAPLGGGDRPSRCRDGTAAAAKPQNSFDSDKQALLYDIVRCLGRGELGAGAPLLYAIGREGPVPLPDAGSVLARGASGRDGLSFSGALAYGALPLLFALLLFGRAAGIALAREDWQRPCRLAAYRRRLRECAGASDAVPGASVRRRTMLRAHASALAHALRARASPPLLWTREFAGAPWWTQARVNAKTVVLYVVAAVALIALLAPFLQQHVGTRSYLGAPTDAWPAVVLPQLALWSAVVFASWAWCLAKARTARGGRWSLLLAAWALLLAAAAAVGAARLSRETLLWSLHLDLWMVAVLALALMFALARRLKRWTFYAETIVRSAQAGKDLSEWAMVAGPKPRFVSTPIEAGMYRRMLETPAACGTPDMYARLADMEAGFRDGLAARMALRHLLLPGLDAIAQAAIAIGLGYFGILLIAWQYPVPGRGIPLLIGLFVAAAGTITLVSSAITFERSALLSRLFCGTEKGLQISSKLMTIVTGPFVLLLLSIVAADQPGMLEWSGGIVNLVSGGGR